MSVVNVNEQCALILRVTWADKFTFICQQNASLHIFDSSWAFVKTTDYASACSYPRLWTVGSTEGY